MNAPHIYSTYIDDSHYHHMHLLNDTDNGISFVISSFGGEGDLTEKFNFALNQMVYNIKPLLVKHKTDFRTSVP